MLQTNPIFWVLHCWRWFICTHVTVCSHQALERFRAFPNKAGFISQEAGKGAEDQLLRGELAFRPPTVAQQYWTNFRLFFALPWRRFKRDSVFALEVGCSGVGRLPPCSLRFCSTYACFLLYFGSPHKSHSALGQERTGKMANLLWLIDRQRPAPSMTAIVLGCQEAPLSSGVDCSKA